MLSRHHQHHHHRHDHHHHRSITTLALPLLPLAAAALLGCSDAPVESPPPTDDLLAPPPAGQGVQFRMTTEIASGHEAEHCQFVQAPAEELYVNRDEIRFSAGSHHVLLYETPYDKIPTADDDGNPVDTSRPFDCSNGVQDGFSVTRLIAGSQNAAGDAFLNFPPNVAIRVKPGAVLMINAHYVNATPEPLKPEVAINLYTIPGEQVEHEGDILFLYNMFIKVDPQSQGRAHMRCPVWNDITVLNIQSHMHARGVGYSASTDEAGLLYTTDRWENVPVKTFETPLQLKAGDTIEYFCDYDNPEARTVYQGPRSTDEMCMVIGSYYPADMATSQCSSDPDRAELTASLGAEWIGQGTATCAETLSCLQAAFSAPLDENFTPLQDCIIAGDPSVSKEASDAFRCILISFADGLDPAMACAAEISACSAM